MSFADPYLLLLLLGLPLLLLMRRRIGGEGAAGSFSNLELLNGYRRTWRVRYRWLPTFIRAAALALLIVALARPQGSFAETDLPGQGIDIALVVDTSGSMSSSDLGDSTRLEVAQEVLTDFIEARENDQLGLVIFREATLVLSPLTLDYNALTEIVDSAGEIPLSDGTAIGVGLGDALDLLRESRARSRVAILLTDGQNNSGTIQPLEAARLAETLGIRVYTIGVIEEGARGRGPLNVDEEALRQMAEITGGRYFPAESEQALEEIYFSVDQLEKSRILRTQFGTYEELAVYFLAGAIGLLVLELMLRGTIWRQAT